MKKLIFKINVCFFSFVTFFSMALAHATSIPVAILDYTNATPAQMEWMNKRFSFKISGNNPNNPAMPWVFYIDMKGLASFKQYIEMKDFAASRGYDYTKMVIHAKIDYTSKILQAWYQMDKFDNFEGANGVLSTSNDVKYTDLTSTAYSGKVKWQNTMYIGYEEPFDQINLVFSTPGAEVMRIWEYWNGSAWSTLTTSGIASDLIVSGQVAFTPPSNWGKKIINKSRSKYFVRCRITDASTNPVTSSIKGDDWLRGSTKACRGWSFTDSNRVNVGTPMEYNPSPPAGSSARFPYQAQISFWGNNHSIFNSAYKVNGKRATIEYLTEAIHSQSISKGYTGVMMDDAVALPSVSADGIDVANTDFPSYSTNNALQESIERLAELTTKLHALNDSFLVGANAKNHAFVSNATLRIDYNLDEYNSSATYTYSPGQFAYGDYSATDMAYDDYLPVNNPANSKGILIYRDDANNGSIWGHSGIPWDMANRGPIAALSKHLIAYNNNLYFSYHTNPSAYVYSETDQVILNDNSVVHLSKDPVPSVSSVKRWATWFPAMAIDFGVPTSARNKAWKLGANIGGGQGVWRRDWSNAIVLHRPALPNVIDAQHYNTYSSPIDLGGTFYPLLADGSTGSTGITTVSLRHNEGAILMKAPVTVKPVLPAATPPVKNNTLQKGH